MAAIFDPSNPASPLAYDASQTALLILDFQGFTIERCGSNGEAVLSKAKLMYDWALARKLMIIHSVVDVHGEPPPTCKGVDRINKMLESISKDPKTAAEPAEIAFNRADREFIFLKHPGVVSGLKSHGATELLTEHGIRSLIICGLSTSGAVLRTAIPATDDGFLVSVIEDACWDPVEGLHDTLMQNVLPSRAHVATAEHFIERWEQHTAG